MTRPETTIRPRRSLLFVPGLRPDRYAKALDAGADIVCVDLEDAVALDRKDEGRRLTLPLFAQQTHPHVERMVRINSITTLHGLKDLQAILETLSPPPSIMIPKVKSAEEVQLLDSILSTALTQHIRFCVIIETNQGLERAMEIARIIAGNAPLGIQVTKEAGRKFIEAGERAAIDVVPTIRQRVMGTDDAAEGIRSFVERRAAVFQGR